MIKRGRHAGETPDRLSLALASCAAALLLQTSGAEAKVIFEKSTAKKVLLTSRLCALVLQKTYITNKFAFLHVYVPQYYRLPAMTP